MVSDSKWTLQATGIEARSSAARGWATAKRLRTACEEVQ